MRSILITGTDTGIGKTHVTGLIARLLSQQGRVQVVKLVESGCGYFPSSRTRLSGKAVSSAPESVRHTTRPSGSTLTMVPLIEPRKVLTRSPGW
jgi:dethiobiotin synthetase